MNTMRPILSVCLAAIASIAMAADAAPAPAPTPAPAPAAAPPPRMVPPPPGASRRQVLSTLLLHNANGGFKADDLADLQTRLLEGWMVVSTAVHPEGSVVLLARITQTREELAAIQAPPGASDEAAKRVVEAREQVLAEDRQRFESWDRTINNPPSPAEVQAQREAQIKQAREAALKANPQWQPPAPGAATPIPTAK